MRAALVLALTLCILGVVVGVVFTVLTLTCGARSVRPDEFADEPRGNCVSVLHPIGPLAIVLGVSASSCVAKGLPRAALVFGAILLAMGVASAFSAGSYGIGAGLLVLAGGIVATIGGPRIGARRSIA